MINGLPHCVIEDTRSFVVDSRVSGFGSETQLAAWPEGVMSLFKLKAAEAKRIAPEALFGGPILSALTEQGPQPGAGRCSFLIVEDTAQEGYTVDLETAEVYAGIPEDSECKLVLHADAFDALIRGQNIDGSLSAQDGGAEIYGDPSMLETISSLLTDGARHASTRGQTSEGDVQ